MLRLYTSVEKFKEKNIMSKGIMFIDAFFNDMVTREMLGEREEQCIKKYENAEFISETDAILKGRSGIFTLEKVSSGVKVLLILSLIHSKKIEKPAFVNITECGKNVINDVFKILEVIEVPALIKHTEIYGCGDYKVIVNDKYTSTNTVELVDLLNEIQGGLK